MKQLAGRLLEVFSMMKLLSQLNADDRGVVTIEYLVLGTILGLGLIVGVTALTGAINTELVELGEAVLSLNQGYSSPGFSACGSTTAGSAASDVCGTIATGRTTPVTCPVDAVFCTP
jgi:Flp pilus assembly pilin Flp